MQNSNMPLSKLILDPSHLRAIRKNWRGIRLQEKLPPLTLEEKREDVRRHMAQAEQMEASAKTRR
jgi:hypothetical protein